MKFILLWILQGLVSGAASLVIAIAGREWFNRHLSPVLARLGIKSPRSIDGVWLATFYFGPERKPFIEAIKLKTRMGQVIGCIEPHPLNYPKVAAVAEKRSVRLQGTIKEVHHFTGVWEHPIDISHELGAFHLFIDSNHREIKGLWLGFTRERNAVEAGDWIWQRLTDENLSPLPILTDEVS